MDVCVAGFHRKAAVEQLLLLGQHAVAGLERRQKSTSKPWLMAFGSLDARRVTGEHASQSMHGREALD